MMFVISKELVKSEEFSFSYNGLKINNTTGYKYLGWHIDQTLNLSDRFEKAYKKISSHLRLLSIPLSNLRKKEQPCPFIKLWLFHCFYSTVLWIWTLLELKWRNYIHYEEERIHHTQCLFSNGRCGSKMFT